MLITQKSELLKYKNSRRLWQGIPSIETTPGGRVFISFYSGGIAESIGNFAVLIKSDNGVSFDDPIAVALPENGHRCFDPCVWSDPLGRLWFTWSYAPNHAVYATICDHPDADTLVWSKERIIGKDVMMNKPTVLSTGAWLFPMAVWNHGVVAVPNTVDTEDTDRGSFVYRSLDCGKTIEKYGKADVPGRSYDEHMVLERKDGTIAMYVRTGYGIGASYSVDGGKTWSKGKDSGLGGPCSRFFIRRLASGRILLINHYNYTGRNNLTALLSEDDGQTWKYKLLLDGRDAVSYPDATQTADGSIFITYDRERGSYMNSLASVYNCAREILIAKITEEDIIKGQLVSDASFLQRVASKLSKYELENENPYRENI